MRLIDGDALTDEIMERYCKECDNRKGIKNGKYRIIYEIGDAPCRACPMDDIKDELDNAPTIEPERKKDTIQKFHDYQVEWLLSHCDLELEPQLEEWVVRFLHDTANCYMMEIDREEGEQE